MKAQIAKLAKEEMGFGTKVKHNNFKTAVEQFTELMRIVSQEINNAIKSH